MIAGPKFRGGGGEVNFYRKPNFYIFLKPPLCLFMRYEIYDIGHGSDIIIWTSLFSIFPMFYFAPYLLFIIQTNFSELEQWFGQTPGNYMFQK